MSVPPSETAAAGTAPPGPGPERMLIFVLEGADYALPLDAVVEVVGYRPPTVVPGARPGILGILPVRGRMVTVLDGRARLGLPAGPKGSEARLIVLRDGGEWMALLVDAVRRVGEIPPPGQGGALRLDPAVILGEER